MRNMKSIISSHNKALLNTSTDSFGCNCQKKNECPLENKYTETTFQERYGNHIKSFAHRKFSKDTELSNYVWSLKDQNKIPLLKWSI